MAKCEFMLIEAGMVQGVWVPYALGDRVADGWHTKKGQRIARWEDIFGRENDYSGPTLAQCLTSLSQDGWELVAMSQDSEYGGKHTLVLKRPCA